MSEQIEKLEQVRALAAEIDRKAELGVAPRIHDHGEECDPSLQIGAATVCWMDDLNEYSIGFTKIIRGCRTMRNGDPGWPDEEEFFEFNCTRSALTAACLACKLALQIAIDQAAEDLGIDRVIADVEKQE